MKTSFGIASPMARTILWTAVLAAATFPALAERWEARAPGPPERTGHSEVWTGTEMIVWGGGRQSQWLDDGAVYNLANDNWRPVSPTNAPSGRWAHAAVWTGTEMIVWGGRADFFGYNHHNDGGRYDPVTDTWRPTSTSGAPAPRSQFAYVWTGTELIVWGGMGNGEIALNDGARYNPETDTWTPMSAQDAPSARIEPKCVWTGEEMIVWGGLTIGPSWITYNTGARYNPTTDTWTPLPTNGAPIYATGNSVVWTGTEMLVHGGRYLPPDDYSGTGARFNPANNTWSPITTSNAPSRRINAAHAWSGTHFIVWGGVGGPSGPTLGDGGRYDPAADIWTPITPVDAPHVRMCIFPHNAVWTGEGMLFYGGSDWPWEVRDTAYYLPDAPPPPPKPPQIDAHPQGATVLVGDTAVFTVQVRGTPPLTYQWQLNEAELPGASGPTLTLEHVELGATGGYRVIVANEAGAATSHVAQLTVVQPRVLQLGGGPGLQEGDTVTLPLSLISEGDVGGLTFAIHYNPQFLKYERLEWLPVGPAYYGVHSDNPGEIQGTLVLPATTIAAGTTALAEITFQLRSVPYSLATSPHVEILDAADASGEPLSGTIGRAAPVEITVREIIGDNNANDRLDVGDATVLLRYLAGLEPLRDWDTPLNDLNQNARLDSGDAIKVLRVAAEIDPQPGPVPLPKGGTGGVRAAASPESVAEAASPAPATLTASATRLVPGGNVTIRVQLPDLGPLSGAAFSLNYPTNALRLVDAQACRVGALVPANALAVWNVAPAQNDFARQNGRVSLAASSAASWPGNAGVLAELTFHVQPGAASQYRWPVTLTGLETTEDGYRNHQLAVASLGLSGRDPVPGSLSVAPPGPGGAFVLTLDGDAGATYVIEVSSDLAVWEPLTTAINGDGKITIEDPEAAHHPQRFYRARVAP